LQTVCSGWLVFPGRALNQDSSDLYFQEEKIAGVSHRCRAPFPILKLSGDGTVHHFTSTIKTLPKKDEEQTSKDAPIAQDILNFTYSIAEPGNRSTPMNSENNKPCYPTGTSQRYLFLPLSMTGILSCHKLYCD
jgi:hypothetical protein